MSIPDALIEKYVRLISGLDTKQQVEVLSMKPRDAKAALARQLVKRLHGEDAARKAEQDFEVRFRKRDIPDDVPTLRATMPGDLVNSLIEIGFATSRTEARRLIEQGGVRANGEKIGVDYRLKNGDVLQRGRRQFVRVEVK
jgi:tyrosyl-tRNA synthetase